jgi:hypothetical protein
MDYPELLTDTTVLFHGSDTSFTEIELVCSIPKKDFGRGFYTTSDKFQAEKFARLKAKRVKADKGYVMIYKFQNKDGMNIKQFSASNEEWFDFVLCNRGYDRFASRKIESIFDIVIGPVANDAVGLVMNQFISGVYGDPTTSESKETAIRLLLTQKLHNQIFFATESAISCLVFSGVYDVYIN